MEGACQAYHRRKKQRIRHEVMVLMRYSELFLLMTVYLILLTFRILLFLLFPSIFNTYALSLGLESQGGMKLLSFQTSHAVNNC